MLAMSNTWFKNIWEFILYFNVGLNLNGDFHLKPVWRGNTSLMLEFLHIWELDRADHESLNVMTMHKKVIHLSDIVLCDGKIIKPEMLLDIPGQSDTHKFPHQRPTPADLSLWRRASARLALSSTSSRSHCRTMLVPNMIFHGECLTTMVWSYIMGSHMAIKNTTKYIHQSQIHLLARPNLVNNSCLTEWSWAHWTYISMQVSLIHSWITSFYNLPFQCLFSPHPCLDLSTRWNIFKIRPFVYHSITAEMALGYSAAW